MAVAMKSAAVARTTEMKSKSVPISRRYRRRRNAKVVRTVICIVGMLFLLGYVGLYAQLTLYGYHKAELARQTRQVEMENQALRAEIQALSSPERLAQVAASAGMEPGKDVIYVYPTGGVKVASAKQ